MDNSVLSDLVINRLGGWVPVTVHGPCDDRLQDDTGGDPGIGNRAKQFQPDPALQICRKRLHDGASGTSEPHGGKFWMELRRAVHQLDGTPIRAQRVVHLADNLREFRTRIGHSLATERRKKRPQRGLLGHTVAYVLERYTRPRCRKGELERGRDRMLGICRAHHEIKERLFAFDVEVQSALGDAHGLGDVSHLRVRVPSLDEDLGGAVDELLETAGGNHARHELVIHDRLSQSSTPSSHSPCRYEKLKALGEEMTESGFTVVRSVGFLLAVAIAVSLQRITPQARLQGSWRTNLGLWVINAVVLGVVCGACAYTVARWARAAGVGVLTLVPMPRAVAIIASVVLLDVVSYGWHRANHQLRWLWQFHQVHHSDTTFTVSTGVRFHPGELLLSLPVRLAAVVALGAPAEGVLFFELIFAVANLVEHGDISLPARLERRLANVLITPALHRRHHSKQLTELNTNFGTIFSVWDRWFRTFLASSSVADVQTGLPGMSGAPGLLQAVLFPVRYRSMRAWR